ncbi:hypothetical protein [Xenorhabdus szentirmaii]|uniref:DUF930 domain-containing protein n=1 Tax=Xenorhabdus szentirmaii DSM 16338 TaxID=1427518 RepID=W1J546_9GAMM|nr:hypothetical protein [Xenorhabdus szentirmaii]PHM34545.1 hypothetical protein Xsze_00977 [Xenorhabdus szentirmaii DSM 16338]PHM43275.1 hypothetical protein Xszus_03063 [Xenorhabdus szentirmaii]CDL84956.1 conserved exported hypothetical protein [Xenorhabdus szentirmaii DSM 16338]
MFYSKYLIYFGASCLLLSSLAQAQTSSEQLSSSQKKYLEKQISEQVTDKSALKDIASWPDSKKVAEFICRPFALPAIKKYHRNADKVFLGEVLPDDIELISSSELMGIGTYRTGIDWHDIQFTCKLDATGKAHSFTFEKFEKIAPPKLQTGPGPVFLPHKEN